MANMIVWMGLMKMTAVCIVNQFIDRKNHKQCPYTLPNVFLPFMQKMRLTCANILQTRRVTFLLRCSPNLCLEFIQKGLRMPFVTRSF